MLSSDPRYGNYLKILQEELVPATGCTEPIAIAYGAAKARELLGVLPESVLVEASGNIIKNVKSVVVPNTNSLKGIEAAAAAGIVAGQSDKILEVISEVTPAQRAEIRVYLADHPIVVKPAEGDKVFDILITLRAGNNHVKLRISDYHTHIVYIEKNGEVLFQSGEVLSDSARDMLTDRSCLSVEGVLDFASTCNLEDVRALIERQIDYNYAIAEEGMRHSWGANIGSVLKEHYGVGIYSRARYMAAAGSDARMSGCEMPVIIVSGSGNQGITASVPVVEYAKELNVSRDQMVRAVLLSDLLTIHREKGRLNNFTIGFCGDLKFGRTVHSLIKTMARCKNIRFVLISPEELRVPDYIVKDVLEANGIPYQETRSLEESMSELDILYMTRVQKERFFNEEDYIRLKNSYILTKEKMGLAKPDMAVLHPLPRVNEIALDVDDDPRAAYFEQVQNGVYVRMALIMTLLGLRDPKAPKEEN